jgi:tripartite-type tricarboxylate transporter receptor subunit TctC
MREAPMPARHLAGAIVLALALAAAPLAQAQEQPIRLVFPFAAGGGGDALARLVADRMRGALNRAVIVENRVGAAGRAGVMAVRNAAPDGGTLLITPIAPMTLYQHVYKVLEYDPVADFVAVSQLVTFDFALAVGPTAPPTSLKQLVAWVKADPSRAAFGSPGAGTLPHFLGLLFARAAGLELRNVPYKGSAATLTDLAAGHVPMVIVTTADLLELHRAKRIRMLATSGAARSPFVPEVPTFREAGYGIEGDAWYGIFAPARTPPAIIERYSKIVAAAVQSPEIKERLLKLGMQATGTTAAEFGTIQKADSARWAPVVKASGFRADQ